jgi:ubiquitin C-terminal hydrolase
MYFGLPNVRGSCWVNAALQAIYSLPQMKDHVADPDNPIDVHLTTLYTSNGTSNLKDLFQCVKTSYMPAGDTIGDSHELIVHLCDKLPWLDKLLRFKVGNRIECKGCKTHRIKEDSVLEINVTPTKRQTPILEALQEFIRPAEIEAWDCEACKSNQTCTSQIMFGGFPKILMIHRTSVGSTMTYSSVLVINGHTYALFAVVCFNGGHWWTYARPMPPGQHWYELNDTSVKQMPANHFPVAGTMRILLYFLVEN